jgi:hypothetical protein
VRPGVDVHEDDHEKRLDGTELHELCDVSDRLCARIGERGVLTGLDCRLDCGVECRLESQSDSSSDA